MIKEILGILLIFIGIWLYIKNKENIFQEFRLDVFKLEKKFLFVSLLLIIFGIILILW